MEILKKKINNFLKIEEKKFIGSGLGDGSGNGYGNGSGSGYDSGKGDGRNYGYWNGYGSSYGKGYGLSDGSGNGYSYGLGDGLGDGYGYGYGNGSGLDSGSGVGYGYGDGSGSGVGYGAKWISINKNTIYNIDDIPTIIMQVHGNIAKGQIINKDLTMDRCYIVKGSNCFAHGKTLKEANESLQEKIYEKLDTDEAIKQFKEKFTNMNEKYAVKDLYIWHHILTGSCEMGRKSFAKNHNIDIDKDKLTIKEFIKLTENHYGGDIIKQLKESYK